MHLLQQCNYHPDSRALLPRGVAAQRLPVVCRPRLNCWGQDSRLRHSGRAQAVSGLSDVDLQRLSQAAELSQSLMGVTAPHPNAGCLLFNAAGQLVGSGCQRAQGSSPSEVLAAKAAHEAAQGSTAYLNIETGDCHGDEAAVAALVQAGVSRVVIGLRHPLSHLRDKAISAYSAAGLEVCVLGEAPLLPGVQAAAADAALMACLTANEALMHRAVLKRPLSVLKYAMTLDGKIATAAGHSAWVSSPASRAVVFECRAASDAVIVGGNTVRRDNPRLTTRRDSGHLPVRVVMSRTLDLPDTANLWDTQAAPTIVMTQRGARKHFQQMLRAKGVEVVEFDFLTPDAVADYCYERGFLQVFWECGGTLAAPAIASGVLHKVVAFVAPKIIGGTRAPTPVGELGNVEMTQAVNLSDTTWKPVGPDLMMTGYLPSSGGLLALEQACSYAGTRAAAAAAAAAAMATASDAHSNSSAQSSSSSSRSSVPSASGDVPTVLPGRNRPGGDCVINFYKAWDEWGALSNFSPHPINMPVDPVPADSGSSSSNSNSSSSSSSSSSGSVSKGTTGSGSPGEGSSSTDHSEMLQWTSVEHFYQSQKFAGVQHADAVALVAAIAAAESPEEAARLGRQNERQRPDLLRPDWSEAKRAVMLAALRAKFDAHSGPRQMLLSTATARSNAGRMSGVQQRGYAGTNASPIDDVHHHPHQQQHFMAHSLGLNRFSRHDASSTHGSLPAGPAVLIENSPHDKYWGQGYDGLGQNHLGQLLMQVRDELLLKEQQQTLLNKQQPQQQLQKQDHSCVCSDQQEQEQEQQDDVHHSTVAGSSPYEGLQRQRQRQQQGSHPDVHAGLAS